MNNLTDLCINTIAEQIYRAPPMIQEMIIEQSSDIIEKKVKIDVQNETVNELKVLKTIVPSITKSLIINRASFFNNEIDYYKVHKTVPAYIVKIAIDIAENTITELNNSFNLLTSISSGRYNFYNENEYSEQEKQSDEDYDIYQTENSDDDEY